MRAVHLNAHSYRNNFGVLKQTNEPGDSSALPAVEARHPKEPAGRGASMGSPSLNELSTDYCQSGYWSVLVFQKPKKVRLP